jgi:hypothetical protein
MLLQSTTALATSPLHDGSGNRSSSKDTPSSPPLPPLGAVIVVIALGDLAFLVLRLACNAPLLRRVLVLIEDCLLRERHLGRDEVGAFQLRRQEHTKINPEKIIPRQRANETCREDRQLTNFSVPALGSIRSICDGGHE